MRAIRLATSVLVASAVAGCADGHSALTNRSGGPPSIQFSADDSESSTPLPIVPSFANRKNHKNDGSSYEPCVAITARAADRLGLDPATIEDLATIPTDGIRGCRWKNRPYNSPWSMTQAVTNWPSLEVYKRKQQIGNQWRPNIAIAGREVGIYRDSAGSSLPSCATYVQSGHAGVITMVTNAFRPTSQFDECAKAVEATTAVIDQIPR